MSIDNNFRQQLLSILTEAILDEENMPAMGWGIHNGVASFSFCGIGQGDASESASFNLDLNQSSELFSRLQSIVKKHNKENPTRYCDFHLRHRLPLKTVVITDKFPVKRCHYCKDKGIIDNLYILCGSWHDNKNITLEDMDKKIIKVQSSQGDFLGEFEILQSSKEGQTQFALLARDTSIPFENFENDN